MTPVIPLQTATCARRRAVDEHFARRLSVSAERELRDHLPRCTSCCRHYQRLLALEQLDPARHGAAQARLGRALGLERQPDRRVATAAVALAAALVLVLGLLLARRQDVVAEAAPLASAGFTARGGAAEVPGLLRVYRIRPGMAPAPAQDALAPGDELAFGYVNASAKPWLLVYGVDEHGHVYWFHPSWQDPAEDPGAVRAAPGAQLHELPEAVSHALDGRTLTVHGVLSDRRLTVREVERLLAGRAPDAPLPLEGAEQSALTLRVVR